MTVDNHSTFNSKTYTIVCLSVKLFIIGYKQTAMWQYFIFTYIHKNYSVSNKKQYYQCCRDTYTHIRILTHFDEKK